MTIATLAGFGWEGKGINLDNDNHLSKLMEGYDNWKTDLYSVFWHQEKNTDKRWLCNVFVGDSIYLFNHKNFTAGNGHYFNPEQIYTRKSPLRKRNSHKDVQIGDIVVFKISGKWSHVEIITNIKKNLFADDGFCSIGAGRSLPPSNNGGTGREKCDGFFEYSTREIDNNDNAYFYV